MSTPEHPPEPEPTEPQPTEPQPGPATPPPPPAAGPPPPRKLTRSSEDRMLGGVAGGLGRYFSVDPMIFRISFVVLAIAGGAGALGYLAAWLLVPSDAQQGAARTDGNRAVTVAGGVVLAVAALAALGPGLVFIGPPLLGLAVLALIGVVLWRAAGGEDGDAGRAARRIGLGILLLVVVVAGFLAVVVGATVGGGAIIAGLVIATGVALVVGAFLGGARWLVIPALVLAVPLGLVAASGIDGHGGIGDRNYNPTTTAELRVGYKLGIGRIGLDLRGVDLPAGRTDLKVDMGIGSLQLVVPADVCVASRAHLGAGYVHVLDRESGGVDVDWRQSPAEGPKVKRLVLDSKVGVGALEVVHDPSLFGGRDHTRSFSGSSFSGNSFGGERNAACTTPA